MISLHKYSTTSVFILLLLFVAIILTQSASAQVQNDYYIRYAQIIHSNGARTPNVNFNTTLLCGNDKLCNKLTITGMRALSILSNYIRNRYNDLSLVETQFFPTQELQPTSIRATSIDVDYTMQSAQVFLRSLFPSNPYWIPYVEAVNASTDFRYSTNGLPSVFVKKNVNVTGLESVLEQIVDDLFTTDELQSLANSAYVTGNCSDNTKRGLCSLLLHEITEYFAVVDQLREHVPLANARVRLQQVWNAYYRYLFNYNISNSEDRLRGSSGQFFANQLIQNINNYISTREYNVHEYSIESDMITALAVTLGDNSNTTFASSQGSTIAIELLQRKTDGTYFVHVLRGSPTLQDFNYYTFTEYNFNLQCVSQDGTVYSLSNSTCPLEDFVRFVALSQSTQPNGECILNTDQDKLLNCPTNVQGSVPHYCALYRENCPSNACASNEVLSAVGLQCYAVNVISEDNYVVRLSQILHRHGARAPLVSENQSYICGDEYQCGYLNYEGMQMLRTVGIYLRNRYNNLSIVEIPFFALPVYNASLIYTRSTFFERTIQSAAALLHGIFPSNKTFYPAIFTIAKETDSFLNSDYIPSAFGRRYVDIELITNAYLSVVDEYISWAELQLAASQAYYSGNCANYSDRANCALDLFDIGMSFQATNQLSDKPALQAILPALSKATLAYYRFIFGYNASDPFERRQGPVLYNLIQLMIQNIQSEIVSPTTYKMYEYSAHDTTVAPFAVALGDNSDVGLTTSYGITYDIELLQNTNDNSYHVRVIRGFPVADNSSETGYTFQEVPYVQRCINAQGIEYNAPICPLNDFVRFINSTAPTDAEASCLMTSRQQSMLNCPAPGATTSVQLPDYCHRYRTICPAYACETNYILSASDLLCYPVGASANGMLLSDSYETPSSTPQHIDSGLLQQALLKLSRLSK